MPYGVRLKTIGNGPVAVRGTYQEVWSLTPSRIGTIASCRSKVLVSWAARARASKQAGIMCRTWRGRLGRNCIDWPLRGCNGTSKPEREQWST